MSNILPQQTVSSHTRMLRSRILVVIGSGIMLASFTTIVMVVPEYLRTHAEKSAIELTLLDTSTSTPREARDALGAAKRRAEALQAIAGTQKLNEAIAQALASKPGGISVTGVRYEHTAKGGTLTISGHADGRQDILDYVQHLKLLPLFSDAYVPVSSLTSNDEGKFDVIVNGTF